MVKSDFLSDSCTNYLREYKRILNIINKFITVIITKKTHAFGFNYYKWII